MIELLSVSKVFKRGFWGRKFTALEGLSFDVKAGEILGYLGPNGAGKTTTIKLIANLIRPTTGKVLIGGLPVTDERARRRLGYLPEQPYFYQYLTGWEFLLYCAGLAGIAHKPARIKGEALLRKMEMWEHRNAYLRTYSRGMLQRIGLAQALIHDPDYIILDEPMEGLDPIGRRLVKSIIRDLKAEGRTILFSTHILEDVESLCDRIAIISGGRLMGMASVGELLETHVKLIEIQAVFAEESGARAIESMYRGARREEGRISISVGRDEDIFEVMTAIRLHNGKVSSVLPQRASLEEIFVQQVCGSRENRKEKT